ncbi:MAG: phosphodiester glycosidase family protein [Clostridiales Family XIII bacterium]|nr:phosphodiester glycosidase family protein [Clostridiales Family XIII bacterium]
MAVDPKWNDLLWEISGYFTEDTILADHPYARSRNILLDLEEVTITLEFNELDPWPFSIEVKTLGGNEVILKDFRPFGEEKKLPNSLDSLDLFSKLEEINVILASTPKLQILEERSLASGLWLTNVKVNFGVRLGKPLITILKIDPLKWTLSPYSEKEDPEWELNPVDIRGWVNRVPQSQVIFNGGQYYADRTSMGFLSREGILLEAREHPIWKGYLGFSPLNENLPNFKILDKLHLLNEFSFKNYQTLLQSFMILDDFKQIRVKQSDRLASRVVVGQDSSDNLLVVFVEGGITLFDLSILLEELSILPAIGLDGGFETQMAIKVNDNWKFYQGKYSNNFLGNIKLTEYHPSLPLILALTPRDIQ